MNTRRDLLIVLGATTLTPRTLFAQAKKLPVLIGWLHFSSRESSGHLLAAFKEGLAALGWHEGSRIVIEERWAEGRSERLQPLAAELAEKKPALIVAAPGSTVAVAAKAAPATPIVAAGGVGPGTIASLARPGGMVTGVTTIGGDLAGKHIELLLEAVPGLRRVGFLVGSATSLDRAQRLIARHAVEARFEEVANVEDIESALSRLAKHGVQGLIIVPSAIFQFDRRRIAKFALAQRWPLIANSHEYAEAGALLSYGADFPASYRRAAYYVDRILKGTKPADLPVEQPMTFEMVVNLRTAKALGITLPPTIMVQVTRVIQ
jgi:putative ABC transport system substrate-binding protein